ncbi:uncharacterized protein KIAA1958-like [Ptychodera flava]|uniref:uncharacterized protein KIAA1958-like n=1 Tax=Ptychodera flava TaxID=63121 RepID=UPI003969D818
MADDITQWLLSLKEEEIDQLLGAPPEENYQDEVDDFIQSHQKENTVKTTSRDIRKCTEWLATNTGEVRPIEVIPPAELSSILSKFFIDVRKIDGKEYEPSTLTNIKCSLERYLRDKGYEVSLNDRQFHKMNQALRAKQVDLKRQGKGRKEKKSDAVTVEEEEKMWKERILGIFDAQSANFTMFYLFGKHFGLRGRDEHRQLNLAIL